VVNLNSSANFRPYGNPVTANRKVAAARREVAHEPTPPFRDRPFMPTECTLGRGVANVAAVRVLDE